MTQTQDALEAEADGKTMKIKLPRTNDMNWQQRMKLYEALKFAGISKGFSNFMWVTDAVIDAFNEAELDIPYSAAVPRLSEQDVVTDKTPDTERKDGSAYQAGRKQDAPTVEAVTELPDGWDLYCLGRASQGEYWLEVREIKSGKLARDLGMSLVYSDTIEGAFKSATKMIEAALKNAAK